VRNFYIVNNVGRVKYVVNYHDGVKTHGDGSPFYDIVFFRNQKKCNKFCNELRRNGYAERP
jgi:hypothetical protein